MLQSETEILKLQKLDKLLVKLENDLKKKKRDIDKTTIVSTTKKTHEIYQIVLYEVYDILENLQLSDLRVIINKIFAGVNQILNIILKINTNFEIDPSKLLTNLQSQIKNRRKSFDEQEKGQNEMKEEGSKLVQAINSVKKTIQQQNKMYREMGTDTGDDLRTARDPNHLLKKEQEIMQMKQDLDNGSKEIDEILKRRKLEVSAVGESNANKNLKDILKDLGKKKREAEDIEGQANAMQDQFGNQGISNLQGALVDGFNSVKKKAEEETLKKIKEGKATLKNGVLVYLNPQETQTDSQEQTIDYKERYDKLVKTSKDTSVKLLEQEKKCKEIQRESDIWKHTCEEMNKKQSKFEVEKKKFQESQKKQEEKKQSEQVLNKDDAVKIKRLLEENIRLKLRIRDLIELTKDLEKENDRNIDRFKNYISSLPIDENLKKDINSKLETMFGQKITKRLNINDLRDLVSNDDFKEFKELKNIVGDISAIQKAIRRDEQIKKAQKQNVIGYDPDFDIKNLNEDEKIIIKKTKKIIERKNSNGEWVQEEIEFDEEIVVNINTGEELRKREKPQEVQQSVEISSFVNQYGGFAIGGSKINVPKKLAVPENTPIGQWANNKEGQKVRVLQGANDEQIMEMEEEYIDEKGQKKTKLKQIKTKLDRQGNEIVEEEFLNEKGQRTKVIKKIVKDSDGNQVVEEMTMDDKGNKTFKKNYIIKDADNNQIMVEETTDAKGNKIIRKVRKDEFGREVVEEVVYDKYGKIKKSGQKKLAINNNGEQVIEEEFVDKFGNQFTKQTKQIVDSDGKIVIVEEITDKFGNKQIKHIKQIVNKDGTISTQEKTFDGAGNSTIIYKNVKTVRNQDGSESIIEEVVDSQGNQIVKKKEKAKPQDQNVPITEDQAGVLSSKIIGKVQKGKQNESGEESTLVQKFSQKGQKSAKQLDVVIEQEVTKDKNGNKITITRKQYIDGQGRSVIEEEYVDPKTGKLVKNIKSNNQPGPIGNQVNQNNNQAINGANNTQNNQINNPLNSNPNNINKQNNLVNQQQQNNTNQIQSSNNSNNANVNQGNSNMANSKINNNKFDLDVKRKSATKIDSIKNYQNQEDHQSSQQLLQVQQHLPMIDKAIQAEFKQDLDTLLNTLESYGINKNNIASLKQQAFNTSQKLKTVQSLSNFKPSNINDQHHNSADQESDDDSDLEEIKEGMNDKDEAKIIHDKLMKNQKSHAEVIRSMKTFLNKQGGEGLTAEEVQEYLNKMKQVHQKCGEICPHLKRFYARLGFILQKYRRKVLKMKNMKLEAKQKLPQLNKLQ